MAPPSCHSRYSTGTDDASSTTNTTTTMPRQRPIEEVERARLRPYTNDEFPWLSHEFESIRVPTARTRSPPQWYRDGQAANQHIARGPSQRSQRSLPRDSIVDLHLIVSDLDYYAGAVHDYQLAETAAFEEDREGEEEEEEARGRDEEEGFGDWPPPSRNKDGDAFGQIQIIRGATSKITTTKGTLVRGPSQKSHRGERDPNLVTWDGPGDDANPKNWSRRKKWLATITVSLFTFIAPVSSSMIAPALPQVQAELHIPTDLQTQLAMSVFILGFALGPLLLGPLSELFGRRIILQLSGLFYLAFNFAAGFSRHPAEIIAFRFLSGLGGSAPLGIGGGVLADIWLPAERGRAMALYSLAPLLGPALGPIAGGFIAEYSTWRWVFWSTSLVAVLVQLLGLFFLPETYAAAILGRKKQRLVRVTGNPDLHTEFDHPSRRWPVHLAIALQRPFVLLATQPIVQVLALYIAYVYGVLYLVLASFPAVWATLYHERPALAALNYLSLGLGFFLGTQVAARFADRIYRKLKAQHDDQGRSEFRVPLMFPGAVLVPAGLLLYGWSAAYRTHWILPNLGTALFAAGNQLVFQNCQTYLVDAYTRFAASAIAATAVFRSLAGFAFPLFAPALYDALGYGWGNSALAFLGVAVGFPAPFILWWFGEALRRKSTFAAG